MEDANAISADGRLTLNTLCGQFTSVADAVNSIPCKKAIRGHFVTVQKYAMTGGENGWILEINELDVEALV